MDKFYGFMPKETREQFENANKMFTDNMKQFGTQGFDFYSNMKNNMTAMMPNMNNNPYAEMMNFYTTWYNNLENAVAPMAKLMTPNNQSEAMSAWKTIGEMMTEYNTKNAEMQYMMYVTGIKAMDKLAENSITKIKNGEEINSMIKLYQEWLNNSDTVFVELFNSDEYSKIMTETSSLQMKIKAAIEAQMEKMFFSHLPIATRTQMDEVYKSIYDLKKEVRKNAKAETNTEAETETKATTKKSK
jgi:tRNA A37 threonylcarbamoyladenosine modification protein TsaB